MNNETKKIIIKRIEIAAFGALKEVYLEAKQGINLFVAPNESGKTTVAAFIKFIFYGFSGSRLQSIADNEKKKYIPWDLQHASGALTISSPRGSYRIERTFIMPSKETVTVIDTSTGRAVFAGLCPGEVFFGVGEEVFSKSAFFKQLFTQQNGDEALASALQNLIFSADEQISQEKAKKRLKEYKNSIISKQNGSLPKLQAKSEEYTAALIEAEKVNNEIFECKKNLSKTHELLEAKAEELKKVTAERENIEKCVAGKHLEELNALDIAAAEAEKNYEEAINSFSCGSLPDEEFINILLTDNAKLESMLEAINEQQESYNREQFDYEQQNDENPFGDEFEAEKTASAFTASGKAAFITALLTPLFAGLSFLAYFFRMSFLKQAPVIVYSLMGLAALCGISAAVLFAWRFAFIKKRGFSSFKKANEYIKDLPLISMQLTRKKSELEESEKWLSSHKKSADELEQSIKIRLLRYLDVEYNRESFSRGIEKLLMASTEARSKLSVFESRKHSRDYAYSRTNIEQLKKLSEGAVEPKRELPEIERELLFLKSSSESLLLKERELEKTLAALSAGAKNPGELASLKKFTDSEIERLEKKAAALQCALDMLDEASGCIRSTISPKLTEYASEYFDSASAGKYHMLEVDASLNITYTAKSYTKNMDYMSAGTRDSAYLCFRLALIKLLYKDGLPPLMLDDVFGRLDDSRLEAMLNLLSGENKSQIFIFSCLEREAEYLEKIGVEFNRIQLLNAEAAVI